jgi:hypothetical protein
MAPKEVKPPRKERRFEVRLKFETAEIAEKPGYVLQGYIWESGTAYVPKNLHHASPPSSSERFETIEEIGPTVIRVLDQAGMSVLMRTDARRKRRKSRK